MYICDFICTYKMMDNDDDRNDLYRIQILQAFGLHCYDDASLNKKIEELYYHMKEKEKEKECAQLKEIIEESYKVNQHICVCDMLVFTFLFSYDYFDLFHKCLIDFFTLGRILEETKNNLIEKIKND